MPAKTIIPWTKCACCDDFVCNIHEGLHAWECSCPPVHIWAIYDLSPYLPVFPEELDWLDEISNTMD